MAEPVYICIKCNGLFFESGMRTASRLRMDGVCLACSREAGMTFPEKSQDSILPTSKKGVF